jgi:LemA protein
MIWFSLITAVLLVWFIVIYNLLVRDRIRVLTAWSDIEVQLKRRHDLIPKLVDAVKQYVEYESATLSAVTELRAQSENLNNVSEISSVEAQLGEKVRKLIVLAENYPDLKANASFLDLQHNLTDVENHIQYARRYYNGAVNNLNVRIDTFPDLLVAGFFRFAKAEFFDFDDAVPS